MTERTVPKEFNDANIRVAREFKAQRDALVMALKQIKIVCHDTAATTVRHDLALEFVGGIAERALGAVSSQKDSGNG